MVFVQHSTAPTAPLDRACSAAHSTSRCSVGASTTRCARSMPFAAQAGAWSRCGGATSKDHRFSSRIRPSADITSEHSPRPTPSTRISVSAPRGQPLPGNSASSSGNPLDTAGINALARRSAHHTSGRAMISLSETAVFKPTPAPDRALLLPERHGLNRSPTT